MPHKDTLEQQGVEAGVTGFAPGAAAAGDRSPRSSRVAGHDWVSRYCSGGGEKAATCKLDSAVESGGGGDHYLLSSSSAFSGGGAGCKPKGGQTLAAVAASDSLSKIKMLVRVQSTLGQLGIQMSAQRLLREKL